MKRKSVVVVVVVVGMRVPRNAICFVCRLKDTQTNHALENMFGSNRVKQDANTTRTEVSSNDVGIGNELCTDGCRTPVFHPRVPSSEGLS